MLTPRWRKVLSDVWSNKTRTALVVLSIAVGVAAVGAMAHMNLLVARDLVQSYALVNPAHATISIAADNLLSTFAFFQDDLVEAVRRVEGVADAEGRRTIPMRFKHGAQDNWNIIMLVAVRDYDNIRINKIRPERVYRIAPERWPAGAWPPPEYEIVLERTGLLIPQMGLSQVKQGDVLLVQSPGGAERAARVAGLAYDFSREAATTAGMPTAYVTPETLTWLGGPPGYSDLHIRVSGNAQDKAHVERVAARVREQIQDAGYTVGYTEIPEPGTLPAKNTFQTISLVLSVIGFSSLLLSTFLIVNTISAILAQQTRQIGVMKAIGATASQMMGMYLGLVAAYGLLALLLAVPLAAWGARAFINFLAYFVNFEPGAFSVPPEVIALEIAVALLAPLLAALWPVAARTRLTVREAITSYGLGEGQFGESGFWGKPWSFGLPRPLMLSLRNAFRRKGRMALTLITLTLACAIFIAVMSARTSAYLMIDDMIRYWNFDIEIFFTDAYRLERIAKQVQQVPGVTGVETLNLDMVYRIRPDDTESRPLRLIAVAHDTEVLGPVIIQGRWLAPDDENAIVLNARVLQDEPDIHVGSQITLKTYGRETTWEVVGLYQVLSIWKTDAHVKYDYFSRLVNQPERASGIAIKTLRHDAESQLEAVKALEERFQANDIHVLLSYTTSMLRTLARGISDVVIILLSTMAVLVAVVGGLGLMGTMSINVLERTREIGVMRAIGASDGAVRQIVIAEGVFIGILSWLMGTALAYPLGKLLSDGLGMGFMGSPFPYEFSVSGAAICLVGVIGIAALASLWPAWNASRLTVREVLVYE